MRVLLVSTYEMGHQPLHLAAPAAELAAAGHDIGAIDLAVDRWDPRLLEGVEAVAISVPMHTALRLAIEVAARIRRDRPDLPLAFYGLYAGVGSADTHPRLVDRAIVGEYEDELSSWLEELAGGQRSQGVSVSIGQRHFRAPRRQMLAPLDRYAHLATGDGHRLVGYTEASHGCRHRCAHCPIPAVYDGRYRITGVDTVVADVAQLVEAGAAHISFGDPDFLNAPAYAMKVLEAVHARHGDLTFDVTVKVSHLLDHADLLPIMADRGVVFITSAFETLDDAVLAILDKGHTAVDAFRALESVRSAGIDLHPTWLPFTPWTTPDSLVGITRFVWDQDLAAVTDPVQLSIRLLIPDRSLLLGVDGIDRYLTGYDPTALGYRWRGEDPGMDRLQEQLAAMAAKGASGGEESLVTLARMTAHIADACGTEIPHDTGREVSRWRITEPWFC